MDITDRINAAAPVPAPTEPVAVPTSSMTTASPAPASETPAELIGAQKLPDVSLNELKAQMAEMSRMFLQVRAQNGAMQRELDSIRSAREQAAAGNVPILFAHCNSCGDEVKAGDDGSMVCPRHPFGLVNHVGVNQTPHLGGGKLVLVKQHTGIAANVA